MIIHANLDVCLIWFRFCCALLWLSSWCRDGRCVTGPHLLSCPASTEQWGRGGHFDFRFTLQATCPLIAQGSNSHGENAYEDFFTPLLSSNLSFFDQYHRRAQDGSTEFWNSIPHQVANRIHQLNLQRRWRSQLFSCSCENRTSRVRMMTFPWFFNRKRWKGRICFRRIPRSKKRPSQIKRKKCSLETEKGRMELHGPRLGDMIEVKFASFLQAATRC